MKENFNVKKSIFLVEFDTIRLKLIKKRSEYEPIKIRFHFIPCGLPIIVDSRFKPEMALSNFIALLKTCGPEYFQFLVIKIQLFDFIFPVELILTPFIYFSWVVRRFINICHTFLQNEEL